MSNSTTVKTATKRRFTGTVVSDKMSKTRVVLVERTLVHPKYGKRYRVSQRFLAHDEANATKVGDRVTIEATRPLSARKRFRIVTHVA